MRFFPALLTAEKGRPFRIAFFLLVLGGLIAYGACTNPLITLSMCLDDPQRWDGTMIVVGNESVVRAVEENSFTISYLGKLVRVKGRLPAEAVGQFIIFRARFTAPDRLEAVEIHVANGRRAKIVLSLLPTIGIGIWFMRRFRFNLRSMMFEAR